MTFPLLDSAVRRAFTELCWKVGTPVAYKALLALKADDWVALTTVRVEVAGYRCPRTLSGDLQIAAFFKKYPGFDLGIDLEKRAEEVFWDAERQCYRSNEILTPLIHDRKIYGEGVAEIISLMRKNVKKVLGKCPRIADLEPRFGPGSTYLDVGPLITVPDKMSDSYTLTPNAREFLHAWDSTAWSRYAAAGLEAYRDVSLIGNVEIAPGLGQNDTDSHYVPRIETYVRGNRFTSVPKDAWRRRGICIEPSINLFYQLGVGKWISDRLGKVLGWRKETQQDLHRYLARLGSVFGNLATIDLSNASDTVCSALVKLLLPSDWFRLLSSLRSSHTLVRGRWVKLEKFSSMGNGFTFELETLLFRCIADSVLEIRTSRGNVIDETFFGKSVTTFGDDIICPSSISADVIATLEFLGFKINKSKTFISGDFRESCGGDYFRGLDVRPHFLKEIVNEPHQYIALANGIRRFGIRHTLCGGPNVYHNARLRILDKLPIAIRNLTGPEGLGDLVVQTDEVEWRPTVRSSIRYFRVWKPVPFGRTRWHHFRPGVVLASALYGCGDGRTKTIGSQDLVRMDTSGVLSRVNGEYVSGYRFGHVAFS